MRATHNREGLDVKTWGQKGKWTKRRSQYLLTILLSMYLPVSRVCLEVLLGAGAWHGIPRTCE